MSVIAIAHRFTGEARGVAATGAQAAIHRRGGNGRAAAQRAGKEVLGVIGERAHGFFLIAMEEGQAASASDVLGRAEERWKHSAGAIPALGAGAHGAVDVAQRQGVVLDQALAAQAEAHDRKRALAGAAGGLVEIAVDFRLDDGGGDVQLNMRQAPILRADAGFLDFDGLQKGHDGLLSSR